MNFTKDIKKVVGQSSISLVLVHVLEWVLSRQGWEKRYKKEKEGFLDHLSFIPMRWCFDFFLLHTIQGADAQIYFWLLQYTYFNGKFLHFFILMIKAWKKLFLGHKRDIINSWYRIFFLISIAQFFTQIYMNCFVSS